MSSRIVVVEDDEFIREIITISLETNGFKVDVFPSSTNMWRYLKRRKPDLVFLDLALPNEDGLTICRKLRASPATSDLPIVVVSAMGHPLVVSAAQEAGANAFIKKPFDIDELVMAAKTYAQPDSLARQDSLPALITRLDGWGL